MTTSAGHSADDPVQLSAGSQAAIEVDARHTVADDRNPSAGHAAPLPLQVSCTSHTPIEARHTVPLETLLQLVGPDTVDDGTAHTWQLLPGLSCPLVKHTPPMRQKPSSISPSQSLSWPSHTSVVAKVLCRQADAAPVGVVVNPSWFEIQYGTGVGLSAVGGDLYRTQVTPSAGGGYQECSQAERGRTAYCDASNDHYVNADGTRFSEPRLTASPSGSIPPVVPWLSIPHLALHFRPHRNFDVRVDGGFALIGFYSGVAMHYVF